MPTKSEALRFFRRKYFLTGWRVSHRSQSKNATPTVVFSCQRSAACIAVLTCMYFVPVIEALPPTIRPSTQRVLAPFVQCHSRVCDLRTHYCDEVISSCAPCDDDCHISRIGGNPNAIHECQQKCQWYYLFTSTVSPSTKTSDALTPGALAMNSVQGPNAMGPGNQGGLIVIPYMVATLGILTLALVAIIVLAITVYRFVHKNSPELSGSRIAKDTNEHARSLDDVRFVSPLLPTSDHHTTCVGSSTDISESACGNDQTPPSSITTANTTGEDADTKLLSRC